MDSYTQLQLRELGDIDLAILVSLVAEQHCIFSNDDDQSIGELVDEIRLSCLETFNMKPVIIECSAQTTADNFNEALLVDTETSYDNPRTDERGDNESLFLHSRLPKDHRPLGSSGPLISSGNVLDDRKVADVVIAVNLNLAAPNVQVQALELIRSKRIFTRSSMHVAPKDMLFLAVLSRPEARLSHHLNDLFGMSHAHNAEDGFPHRDGEMGKVSPPPFDQDTIKQLRAMAGEVRLTAEMAQYLHNIVIFLRTSRYIKGGVSATATRQMYTVCRALAPLHHIDYVPPSLVALAARKIYPHRLVLATPENEKSLQWGSDRRAVRDLLQGVTIADVIEEVLGSIETPL